MRDFLFIKSEGENLKVFYSDIIYLESVNKYVKIVTKQKYYLVAVTMNKMEKALPHSIFRRIHRSYIVSLNHIHKFDSNSVYLGCEKLPIVKRYKENLIAGIVVLSTDVKSENKLPNSDLDDLFKR